MKIKIADIRMLLVVIGGGLMFGSVSSLRITVPAYIELVNHQHLAALDKQSAEFELLCRQRLNQ